MKKIKVVTLFGTRPELIRLSCVIAKLDQCFDHTTVHTGQNYDYTLNQIFFEDMDIRKPDYFLESAAEQLGETIGNVISRSYKLLQELRPDALLVLGDTNSALAAISAKRLKIPVFHMEAGNRCFNEEVPEEINRRIVDHISDINLPYTEHSRRYLLAEGFSKDRIFVTGSPMYEVLNVYKDKINKSDILTRLQLELKKYIVVSAHREENLDIDKYFVELVQSLNAVAEYYQMPLVYSVHPRTRKKFAEKKIKLHPLIQLPNAFGFTDYVQLQKNAFCVLSDSGTLTEETAMLSFPSILIRTSTERPEGVDMGTIIVSGLHADRILQAIDLAIASVDRKEINMVYDYKVDNVSDKVARIILGYVDYVNHNVWNK